ncbi:hypothetical protein P9705_001287 [Enterococcus faecalis]|nr:hypothetical protein [Enterococcus faecalis]
MLEEKERKKLIDHAQEVLNSDIPGVKLAQMMKMNSRQLYDYRNGKREIEKARLETLLKFESSYTKIFK